MLSDLPPGVTDSMLPGNRPEDREVDGETLVTVCDTCLTASCWHGEFMCDNNKTAGTVKKSIGELKKLNLEHPDSWHK